MTSRYSSNSVQHPQPAVSYNAFRVLLSLWYETIQNRGIAQTAAALAFTTVLAAVPLFSIALSFFLLKPEWFAALQNVLQNMFLERLVPSVVSDLVFKNLTTFAERSRQISWFGFCFLFFSASAMLWTIENAIARIWGKRRRKGIARRTLIYWLFLVSVPVVISAVLWVIVSLVSQFSTQWLHLLQKGSNWQTEVIPMLIGFSFLVLMLKSLPPAKVQTKDAVLGALVATILIESLKRLLTWSFLTFPTYKTLYGQIVALPFFLLWLQTVWASVLLGAALTSCLPTWRDLMSDKAKWRRRFSVKPIRY
jgi:membrane protein